MEEDRKDSGQRNTGKKFGYLLRLTDAPTKVHLGEPEKPYTHPKTGKSFPFRTGKRHFLPGKGKSKNGVFMECGVDYNEDCVVHAYSNPVAFGLEGVAKDENLAQHKASTYYGVSGWVEEDFHLVEYYRDENDQNAGTFNRRERCLGRGCEYCQEGLPKVFGKRMYLEISPGQWRHSIHELDKRIKNRYCKCGGDIFVTSFSCAGCEERVIDVSETCDCGSTEVGIDVEKGEAVCDKCGAAWSAFYTDHKKLYEEAKEVFKCKCGHRGFLVPNRFCSTENCEVTPFSVFDAQLTLRVTGTKKEKRLIIEDWVLQPPDEKLFDPKFQGDDDLAAKVAESHGKPLDLDYLLRPGTAEDQARVVGKPNPFSAVGSGAGGRYARYDSESDDEAVTQ